MQQQGYYEQVQGQPAPGGAPGNPAAFSRNAPAAVKAQQLVQNAGKRFGGVWKLAFFLNSCCVLTCGILSIVGGAFALAPPFDFINYCFLTLFGLLMLIIDFPLENHPNVRLYKMVIFHYALFLTRFTGRGIWYLFLAAMCVGALWDNEISPFLGFFLGGFIAVVAIWSLLFGVRLSRKLELVRKKVVEQGPSQWAAYIPPSGMTKVQFRELAVSLKGIFFTDEELSYIVNAFSFEVRSDDVISKEEFDEWAHCRSGIFIL